MSQGGRDDRARDTDRQQGPSGQGQNRGRQAGQPGNSPSSGGPGPSSGPNQSGSARRSGQQARQRQQPPPGGPNQGPQSGSSGSSPAKKIAVVLIGVVLLFTVAGANVSMAADRTVLSSDYITETMGEQGVYAEQTTEFRDEVSGEISSATDGLDLPPGIDVSQLDGDAIAQQTVTEEFVRQEVSKNVDRLYEFLHGERDDVEFVVNIEPVKESIHDAIVEGVVVDTPTLVGEATDRIEPDTVAALGESQQSYQETQEQFGISQAEAQALKQEAETKASQSDNPEAVTNAGLEIQLTVIDALAGEITYDEYTSQIDSEEQALKEAIATEGLSGVDDQIQLSDEEEDPSETFGTAATAVQWLSTFTWLLPVLSLVLIGLIAAITRSFDRTAMPVGIAVLLAGLVGAVIGYGLSGTLLSRVEEAATDGGQSETSAFVDGLLSAIDGTLGTLGTQSILLAVLGIVLVGLAYADRNGQLDDVRETLGLEPAASTTPRRQVQTRQPASGGQTGRQPPGQQAPGEQPGQQSPGPQPGQQPPGGQPVGDQPGRQPATQTAHTPSGEPAAEKSSAVDSQEPGPTDDMGGPTDGETGLADQGADTDDETGLTDDSEGGADGTDASTDDGTDPIGDSDGATDDRAGQPDSNSEPTDDVEADDSEPVTDGERDDPDR